MLSLAGRECSIFSYGDTSPVAFLWAMDIACHLLALGVPLQNCSWFIPSEPSSVLQYIFSESFVVMILIAAICASLLTLLDEMWRQWKPFDGGVNVESWTLGIASEIDNFVNEFHEYDSRVVIRGHAYMAQSQIGGGSQRAGSGRPFTVGAQ